MEHKLDAFFSPEGPLAKAFDSYEVRASQREMASMVASIFSSKGFNFIEAATGIGKTFAYLVPSIYQALEKGQKIVISTYTIALQEQLYFKDIPLLLDLLGIECEVALIKGMGNYLCHQKLEKLKNDPAFFKHPFVRELDEKIQLPMEGVYEDFANFLPKEHWSKLTADPSSCLSHTCPSYRDCFFFKARKPIENASIFIVNHHLLLTDLLIRQDNKEGAILPESHQLIIDEAHHLPAIAEEQFSEELTLQNLSIRLKNPLETPHLDPLIKALTKLKMNQVTQLLETDLLLDVEKILSSLKQAQEIAESRLIPPSRYVLLKTEEPELEACFQEIHFLLKNFSASISSIVKLLKEEELHEKYRTAHYLLEKLAKDADLIRSTVSAFLQKQESTLLFFEKTPYHAGFHAHDLTSSQALADLLQSHYLSTTFCSATLTFDAKFDHFRQAIGWNAKKHLQKEALFASDFDYKQAMLFAVPSDMPEPTDPAYEKKLFDFSLSVIKATQGGVFILFTSYDQLYKFAEKIQKDPFLDHIELQVQGTDSKQNLLDQFKSSHHSVLLGTDSFWEGVDVQGDKLRCVILTKLPFRSPGDPLFQAISQKMRSNKQDPFVEKALPEACVKFKQGLGRLIRSKEDYGIVICTDIRIIQKNYGKYFLKTLPTCERKLAPSSELLISIKEKMKKHQKKDWSVAGSNR